MDMIRRLHTLEDALENGSERFMRMALRDVLIASYEDYDKGMNREDFRQAEVLFSELSTFYDTKLTRDTARLALIVVHKLQEVLQSGQENIRS